MSLSRAEHSIFMDGLFAVRKSFGLSNKQNGIDVMRAPGLKVRIAGDAMSVVLKGAMITLEERY